MSLLSFNESVCLLSFNEGVMFTGSNMSVLGSCKEIIRGEDDMGILHFSLSAQIILSFTSFHPPPPPLSLSFFLSLSLSLSLSSSTQISKSMSSTVHWMQ